MGLPSVLAEHGVDASQLLREVRLPAETFAAPDNVVPFATLCRYLELAAARTGLADLGLRACVETEWRSLGPVGYLVANSKTVGLALAALQEYLYVHDQGAVPFLSQEGPIASLGYEVLSPGIGGADQMTFGALAIGANILRELCGPGFAIRGVTFSYRAPKDTTLFRSFFRAPVRFGAERSAIAFDARWLGASVKGADTFIRSVMEERVLAANAQDRNIVEDRIRRVVRTLVAAGRCSADEVAAAFGMSRRTLARRLRNNGSSFRELLEVSLFDAARHLLQSSSAPILEIAERLGYTDAASFTRAFRRWSGEAPSAWRVRCADAGGLRQAAD